VALPYYCTVPRKKKTNVQTFKAQNFHLVQVFPQNTQSKTTWSCLKESVVVLRIGKHFYQKKELQLQNGAHQK